MNAVEFIQKLALTLPDYLARDLIIAGGYATSIYLKHQCSTISGFKSNDIDLWLKADANELKFHFEEEEGKFKSVTIFDFKFTIPKASADYKSRIDDKVLVFKNDELGIDLIIINPKHCNNDMCFVDEVLDQFDIDLCKAAINNLYDLYYPANVVVHPDFNRALASTTCNVTVINNKWFGNRERQVKERLVKYKARFPNHKFIQEV